MKSIFLHNEVQQKDTNKKVGLFLSNMTLFKITTLKVTQSKKHISWVINTLTPCICYTTESIAVF